LRNQNKLHKLASSAREVFEPHQRDVAGNGMRAIDEKNDGARATHGNIDAAWATATPG
jgi:hypothetical protein